MQIRQKYLNASLCKFVVNSLQHSETFDVSHDFLSLTVAELSTLKQVRFFGPPWINGDFSFLWESQKFDPWFDWDKIWHGWL